MGSESISNVIDISTADETDDKTRSISPAEMNDATVNLSRNCTDITTQKLVCFLQYLEKIHVTNATSEKKEIAVILKVMSDSKNIDVVQKFIDSLVEFFQDCFREVESEHKQQREIQLEKVFARKRINGPLIVVIRNAWDNVSSRCEDVSEGMKANAKTPLIQLILQHFWSANNKLNTTESQKESRLHVTKTTSCLTNANVHDSSEMKSVQDHAGWALKRTRDVITKGPNQIPLKQSEQEPTILYADKSSALQIISTLGTDEKQSNNNFRFIVHEHLTAFFLYLHGLVEEMLKPANIASQKGDILLQCLSELSKNEVLRGKWLALISSSDLKAATVVLQRVVTFFLKSKQQIIREKQGIKLNKNSLSLRRELKSEKKNPKPKRAKPSTETKTVKLREDFSCSENMIEFLKNLSKLSME